MILGILLLVVGLASIISVIVYVVREMKDERKINYLIVSFVIIFEIITDVWSFPFLLFFLGLFLILLGVLNIIGIA
ncbi:hypothetical protein [Ectobacillus polymachus]|uniref:hypothetical protein n=1 Tax=Ectobacillus polymachus TaxID=1508806 RepID=UPI003A881DDE